MSCHAGGSTTGAGVRSRHSLFVATFETPPPRCPLEPGRRATAPRSERRTPQDLYPLRRRLRGGVRDGPERRIGTAARCGDPTSRQTRDGLRPEDGRAVPPTRPNLASWRSCRKPQLGLRRERYRGSAEPRATAATSRLAASPRPAF